MPLNARQLALAVVTHIWARFRVVYVFDTGCDLALLLLLMLTVQLSCSALNNIYKPEQTAAISE